MPFVYKLVLNQWLLSLFNVKRFEELAEHLRNEKLEGMDENNVHHFHHALTAQLFNLTQLPTELLLEYDQNIVKHTQRLNERRITRGEEPIVWKYFQYLTLLFTEIYLDRYFSDPAGAADGAQRAGRCLQRRQAGERPDRAFRRDGRGLVAAQQARLLERHRQRQDAADARQHPAVSVLPGQARTAARAEPHHPAHARTRA